MPPEKKILRVGLAAENLRKRVGFFGRQALQRRLTLFHRSKIDEIVEEILVFSRRSRSGR